MFKKIKSKTVFGVVIALIAGIGAFTSEMSEQKRDEHIENMEKRLKVLEERTKEVL